MKFNGEWLGFMLGNGPCVFVRKFSERKSHVRLNSFNLNPAWTVDLMSYSFNLCYLSNCSATKLSAC